MFMHEGIDHVALTVRDVERSVTWYREVLGLQRMFEAEWGSHPAVVGTGSTSLALFPSKEVPADAAPESPVNPGTTGFRHLAFRADRANFIQAQADLERRGIAWEFQDHGVSHSIYFRDPDGHQLEITTYQL